MKRPFVLTSEAKNDLKDIFLDMSEDSPETAESRRSELYDALVSLGQSPGIGHYHDELLSRKYRFWNFDSYVVVYAWQTTPIQIANVVHGARDLAAFFSLRRQN